MKINLVDYDTNSKIYEIYQELDPSGGTNFILCNYKYDYSSMISKGEVPFVFRNSRYIWNVDEQLITKGDLINTFFIDHVENCYIDIEPTDCKIRDINFELTTSKKEFLIQWKKQVKNWGGLHLRLKDKKRFKKFINNLMITPMSFIQAVYMRTSYSAGGFAAAFSCAEKQAISIMKCLGYKNVNGDREFLKDDDFSTAIGIICDNVNGILGFYRENKYINPVKLWFRDIFGWLESFFERRKDEIALDTDITAIRVEPARGERSVDWGEIVRIVILLLFVVVFVYCVQAVYQQVNNTEESRVVHILPEIIVGILSFIGAVLAARWTLTQNYKIDYHSERIKVLPIFSIKCFNKKQVKEYKAEYKKIHYNEPQITNEQKQNPAMYVCFENIGQGVAFQISISFRADIADPVEVHTLNMKDCIIVKYNKCSFDNMIISYRDLYGNLYNEYIKITVNESDNHIEVIEQPPELIMRTKRARYIQ